MRATAQASAHEALQKAQDEMKGEAERQGKALAATLSQQTEEAEARIATAKTAALASLEGMWNVVVAGVSEKVLGHKAGGPGQARQVSTLMGRSGGACNTRRQERGTGGQ